MKIYINATEVDSQFGIGVLRAAIITAMEQYDDSKFTVDVDGSITIELESTQLDISVDK